MVQGKDLLLTVNGRNIAASTGCTITMQQDFIDVASPTDGRAKRVMPSTYGWSASAECICASGIGADTLMGYIEQGTELQVSFYDRKKGLFRKGTAYVSNVQASGSMGSLAKVQVQLQGSGALDFYEEEIDVTELGTRDVDDTEVVYSGGGDRAWQLTQNQAGSALITMPGGSWVAEALTVPVVIAEITENPDNIADALHNGDDRYMKEHQLAFLRPGEKYVSAGQENVYALVYDMEYPEQYVRVYGR